MKDEDTPKGQFIDELRELRHRVAELEASEIERKRTEQALRENEERFRKIAETAGDAIITVDDGGRISYWNPAAEEIFGYTSQEATGEKLAIIIPERYHEDFWRGFGAFQETGQGLAIGKTFISEAIRRDGTEFPVELSVTAMQIKGQWHAVGIARDITKRRRMEELLREGLEKYRLMFDNEKDVIMLVDIEDQRLLEVNKAVESLYGYTREEFLKMRVTDISAEPERRDTHIKEFIDQLKGELPIFLHRKKNGTVFPVEISACAFMWKDRKTFCAIVRDITGRERVED